MVLYLDAALHLKKEKHSDFYDESWYDDENEDWYYNEDYYYWH